MLSPQARGPIQLPLAGGMVHEAVLQLTPWAAACKGAKMSNTARCMSCDPTTEVGKALQGSPACFCPLWMWNRVAKPGICAAHEMVA